MKKRMTLLIIALIVLTISLTMCSEKPFKLSNKAELIQSIQVYDFGEHGSWDPVEGYKGELLYTISEDHHEDIIELICSKKTHYISPPYYVFVNKCLKISYTDGSFQYIGRYCTFFYNKSMNEKLISFGFYDEQWDQLMQELEEKILHACRK